MNTKNVFPRADSKESTDIQRTFDQMSLIDDIFFRVVMRDNPRAAEAIVRVALDMPDVEIESVQIQSEIRFPGRRGVCFDLKAKKPDGTLFDIEVQKGGEGDLPKRSRYYLSSMTVDAMAADASATEPMPAETNKKKDLSELPDAYVLFICDKDPFRRGKPVYSFPRMDEDGYYLCDGGHIVFFNCSYKGEDAYGRLANDLTLPDFVGIADPVLMDTVKSGKIGARRDEVMTELTENLYKLAEARGKQSAREADIIALLKDGTLPPEKIAEILGIPLEDVLALKEREGI